MNDLLRKQPDPAIEKNRLYYDQIADQYDESLLADDKNRATRAEVASYFKEWVGDKGVVLDFGGGTGLDLEWLTRQNYQVIFCEPSEKMRQKAIARFPHSGIQFLEKEATDFRTWQTPTPFPQKADAVLANFAVINCIADTDLLFHQLSLITKPGSHLLILLLKNKFRKKWQANRRGAVLSLFTRFSIRIHTLFNNQTQIVYLHSRKSLKKAAKPYFDCPHIILCREKDFRILHFTRK